MANRVLFREARTIVSNDISSGALLSVFSGERSERNRVRGIDFIMNKLIL